jgi:predicted alpha/beta hydrolase family esterase
MKRPMITTDIKKRLMRSAGGMVDDIFLIPPRISKPFRPKRRISREAYEQQLDFYINQGYVDRPESFFTFPATLPDYAIVDTRPYHDGQSQLIRYRSGYAAQNPLIRETYQAYGANQTGYLVRWTHGDKNRKTVLCHHGYMLGDPRQARKMFRVGRLFSQGLDVALFIAPFHWKRSAGPLMKRGIYLQPDNVVMTCECVGQNMYDLHGAFQILSDLGAGETGLVGASLGGYNTALFVSLTDIPAFGAMMVPAVNFTLPLGPDTARHGFAVDDQLRQKIKSVWELHSPLNFMPKIPVENILVVASKNDRLCPFEYVQALCDKWQIKNSHFLNGGHWLIFNRRQRGRAWYSFLMDMGFL